MEVGPIRVSDNLKEVDDENLLEVSELTKKCLRQMQLYTLIIGVMGILTSGAVLVLGGIVLVGGSAFATFLPWSNVPGALIVFLAGALMVFGSLYYSYIMLKMIRFGTLVKVSVEEVNSHSLELGFKELKTYFKGYALYLIFAIPFIFLCIYVFREGLETTALGFY